MLTGQYRFGVVMFPAEQSQQVQEIVGVSGEAMRGALVEKDGEELEDSVEEKDAKELEALAIAHRIQGL